MRMMPTSAATARPDRLIWMPKTVKAIAPALEKLMPRARAVSYTHLTLPTKA